MHGLRTFADIPLEVERLLQGERERVGVVLLDAFGRRFLERHAGHPFLRRLAVTPLQTQFPSTTAAHVTTMHTGRPVGEHRLYEWNVYEPSLDAIITPLRFSFAGDVEGDTLRAAGLDPAVLIPGDTLYQRLPVPSTVLHPAAFSPSTYDGVATRGARLVPYGTLRDGVEAFFTALAAPGYAYLYWDRIDAAGHHHGPASREFDAEALAALDALERGLRAIPGALLMVTADHGQVAVDGVDFLDELWPELPSLLSHRPAGSARDVFLHTVPGAADQVIAGLRERLEGAVVCRAADLVAPGARLADVCVLPGAGRMAWLRTAADHSMAFRGHHGGRHPDETDTWVGTLDLGYS